MDRLLLETGDFLLLESGDFLLLESSGAASFSTDLSRENAGMGAIGGGPFARANAGLGAIT